MTIDTLKRALKFLLYCLLQALVLNRIQLFNVATPLLYIYFVMTFPLGFPKWAGLLWGFAMGLVIDIFSNTPGLASSSLTLIACIQPYLLQLFLSQETDNGAKPSVRTMGLGKFFTFAITIVFLFCFILFTIEAFNFFNWQHWLGSIVGSTLLTLLFIMAFEMWEK